VQVSSLEVTINRDKGYLITSLTQETTEFLVKFFASYRCDSARPFASANTTLSSVIIQPGVRPSALGMIVAAIITRSSRLLRSRLNRADIEFQQHNRKYNGGY